MGCGASARYETPSTKEPVLTQKDYDSEASTFLPTSEEPPQVEAATVSPNSTPSEQVEDTPIEDTEDTSDKNADASLTLSRPMSRQFTIGDNSQQERQLKEFVRKRCSDQECNELIVERPTPKVITLSPLKSRRGLHKMKNENVENERHEGNAILSQELQEGHKELIGERPVPTISAVSSTKSHPGLHGMRNESDQNEHFEGKAILSLELQQAEMTKPSIGTANDECEKYERPYERQFTISEGNPQARRLKESIRKRNSCKENSLERLPPRISTRSSVSSLQSRRRSQLTAQNGDEETRQAEGDIAC